MLHQPPPPPLQLQTATSSPSVGEPQFATVTFVTDDAAASSTTLRVPLNGTTTVSRLAKDAMKRLVLSRPRDDRQGSFANIAVTEVYVGGGGTQPKAEIFAQDIVSHVVLVREEVIFMKLRTAQPSAAPSRMPTPPPPPPPPPAPSMPPTSPTRNTSTAPSAAAASAQPRPDTTAATGPAVVTSTAAHREGSAATAVMATRRGTNTSAAAAAAAPAAAVVHPVRPGWGPEAYDRFPDNYESTPGKRLRQPNRQAAASTAAQRNAKRSREEKTEAPPVTATTAASEAAVPAALEGERGLRWGPEASKSFADNYVSSPDKMARLARQQRRATRQAAAATAAQATFAPPPPPPPVKARVSRELRFPAEQPDGGRATVGHAVEREVFTVEEDTAVELPKGWGAESLRFFDPNTYCDDPTKARLMPNMDLSRSTRQRRPASP